MGPVLCHSEVLRTGQFIYRLIHFFFFLNEPERSAGTDMKAAKMKMEVSGKKSQDGEKKIRQRGNERRW